MVEFSAPITGKYTIAVYNQRESQDDPNYIGIAWTKQATYLPDIRENYNGWSSKIYIRNDSPTDRYVSMVLFNSNGSGAGSVGFGPIPANYLFVLDLSFFQSFNGSAIINASEDISVVVENVNTNVATNYAGILASDQGGNPDWGQVSTTLYAPTIKYNHYGRYTDLYIQNTGTSSTNITVAYYDDNGTYKGTRNCTNLAANARCVVTLPNGNWGTLLAARITSSSQPIAAIVFERDSAQTQVSTHNAIALGGNTLYAPQIKRNWTPGQTTGLRIYNTENNTAHVFVYYYDSQHPGQIFWNPNGYYINPYGAITLSLDIYIPDNFLGSAVISGDKKVFAEVHEFGSVRKMANNVFLDPGTISSYAVRICQNCSEGFRTGVRVQNPGNSNATVTVTYYNSNGSQNGSPVTINDLPPYNAQNASVPEGLYGSAVITATQPIAVVLNVTNPDTSTDLAMSYSTPNR
jgi:hypothetical protein